ncbi:unnamed protein product [Blumeria hordei]|uniref:Endonuclease/exonuclease/phosphatase domain-containing protein n=1 Tax=Blumeria hordei TaxID=2867405 RepID=A0A383UT78_BLUHO|nr:unnamed protein product [Blumeria hordei]
MNSPDNLEISILTFNCWGLKYLAKFRSERLAEIGRCIASADPVPQIVGLQECWTHQDYQSVRRETRHILPFGKLYHSGIFGAGLAILSKWPIEESSMIRYPLNGRPTAFFRGDWFVGKGIAHASLRYGTDASEIIEVFNTHLHAPYEREPNDSYICHRTAQAWEMSKLLRGAVKRGHLVVGLGDFNMLPNSLAHRLITTHAPVYDLWLSSHPESALGAAGDEAGIAQRKLLPTAESNIVENGTTCDSVYNTWRWEKSQQKLLGPNCPLIEVPRDKIDLKAKRLDYIFASSISSSISPKNNNSWSITSIKVGMMSRHPMLQCSLSDHFSVEATLSKKRKNTSLEDEDGTKDNDSALPSSLSNENYASNECKSFLPLNVYDEVLGLISQYRIRERRQRKLRLSHFVCSFLLTLICLLVVWWAPRNFVTFVLLLVSTFGLSAGVIDGLIGGLFIGSEIRALKEFEWEIRNARAQACGEVHFVMDESITDW